MFRVEDSNGRELSEAISLSAARFACRIHLLSDGEEPPLRIFAPNGRQVETALLDDCGRFLIRGSSLSRQYEREVINRWGIPEVTA